MTATYVPPDTYGHSIDASYRWDHDPSIERLSDHHPRAEAAAAADAAGSGAWYGLSRRGFSVWRRPDGIAPAPMAIRLVDVQGLVKVGDVFDVTNHYITRFDHPCHGTHRRTILAVTGSSFTLSNADAEPGSWTQEHGSRIPWPKAAQVALAADGCILLYGGGAGQGAGELFLTLRPTAGPAAGASPPQHVSEPTT